MGKGMIVPLLGLAGEAGQLLSEYKKHFREGESYVLFSDRVEEELGDLLWYISNVASKSGLSLNHIATRNLEKVRTRWAILEAPRVEFDSDYPDAQRIPRKFEIELTEEHAGERVVMRAYVGEHQLGDPLTDNSHKADGYRFHDIFHLAHAGVLGWSPVLRKNFGCKRKRNARVDEVEDGGRAAVIEEAVAAIVFNYAKAHSYFEGVNTVSYDLLRTIKGMTAGLEVSIRTTGDWVQAILQGYDVFREVLKNRGGRIGVDLDSRRISYLGPVGAGKSNQ